MPGGKALFIACARGVEENARKPRTQTRLVGPSAYPCAFRCAYPWREILSVRDSLARLSRAAATRRGPSQPHNSATGAHSAFGYARVRMPELRRNDAHRDSAHGKGACVGVAKNVEGRGGFDLRSGARRVQWPLLMRWPQTFPSSRTKIKSPPERPTVNSEKSARPSSVSATWRGLPDLLSRTVIVPASA